MMTLNRDMHFELSAYIHNAFANGYSAAELRPKLIAAGWNVAEVDMALASAAASAPKTLEAPAAGGVVPAKPAAPLPPPPKPTVEAYDPGGYALTGFLFSVLPVFLMSLSNARRLPNGERWKGGIKLLAIAAFAVIAGVCGFMGWIAWKVSGTSKLAAEGGVNAQAEVMVAAVKYAGTLSLVFAAAAAANLIILILTVIHANRNERPVFEELKKAGGLKKKSAVRPILLSFAIYLILNVAVAPVAAFIGSLIAK